MSNRLVDDLLSLGVRPGGVLLVHSSYKSLGTLEGGPAEVIQGIQEALGARGTLLMPALSYAAVTPEHALFDVRATPSCVGVIPETFRRAPGVLRSMHPTHSVCASGPRARELLAHHASDTTPCGPGSPFRAVPAAGGQILMLGCGLRPSTSMHSVEELVVPTYLFGEPLAYTLVGEDGTQTRKTYTTHGFVGWEQRYDRIQQVLHAPDLRVGKVLKATCHLLDAARLFERALDRLRGDPLFFVDRVA